MWTSATCHASHPGSHQEKSRLLLSARVFSVIFPRQIWVLRIILLLGSGPLAFETALLCTFGHFRYFESDQSDQENLESDFMQLRVTYALQ